MSTEYVTCSQCQGKGHRSRGVGGGRTAPTPCPACNGTGRIPLQCPQCGEPVPATGSSGALGTGDPPTFGAQREHMNCPSCGTALVRVQDGGAWQVDKSA
jgi:hypothetical protein